MNMELAQAVVDLNELIGKYGDLRETRKPTREVSKAIGAAIWHLISSVTSEAK